MNKLSCVVLLALAFALGAGSRAAAEDGTLPAMPMPVDRSETADARWRAKPVHESRLLSDMESVEHWTFRGPETTMSLVTERARDGKQSLRLACPTWPAAIKQGHGRPPAEPTVRYNVAGEDWTAWNRFSVWVYPSAPGHKNVSFLMKLYNDGVEKMPGRSAPGASQFWLLKNNTWNHLVFEIPHLTRDKVTGVEFIYQMKGSEPGAARNISFDLDHLTLEKVDADPFEGWDVAPGRLAYSHSGYLTDAAKTAIASGLKAANFSVIDASQAAVLGKPVRTVAAVLTKPVRTVKTRLGEFQVLDFSELRTPGSYRIEAGELKTAPFRIHSKVWRDSIVKILNFFYCERCGDAIPGVHDVCHQDWQAVHGDKTIVVNGGWHDAGDLSQGLTNTAEADYAMFELATTLAESDPVLSRRLIEEARWGLDWMLKTRFGDGFRVTWSTMDYWTDCKIGTNDDTFSGTVVNRPVENLRAAATEAIAARALKTLDPAKAAEALKAAREDWRFGVQQMQKTQESLYEGLSAFTEVVERPSWTTGPLRASNEGLSAFAEVVELAAQAALASVELFKTTGEQAYADAAIKYADTIVNCQQKRFTDWSVPMSGFYYTNPQQNKILHYLHRGHEQAPSAALAGLCEALPEHPNWIQWYAAVARHGEYLRRLAEFTAPFYMMPASVYEVDKTVPVRKRHQGLNSYVAPEGEELANQIRNGVKLDETHYLRMFPVWTVSRGNSGVGLSQAKALSVAARLRGGDRGLIECCLKQLEWTVGRNPFGQSLLYGEGHDYAPLYTASSGDLVGSLPVGIMSLRDRDLPYWPMTNCHTYKEVWVHPALRWLGVQRDLIAMEGEKTNKAGEAPVRFTLAGEGSQDGQATLRVKAEGTGRVRFAVRAENLKLDPQEMELKLDGGKPQTLTLTGRIEDLKQPWIAVVYPAGNLAARKDVLGGYPKAAKLVE